MKKIIILITSTLLILSFAACGSPAVQEDDAQTTATIEPAEAPTPAPTPTQQPTPTPEPTPTPVVLTAEEQEYLELFEYLPETDIYAAIILTKAYENSKLDNLINQGIITQLQIDELKTISQKEDFSKFYSSKFFESLEAGLPNENPSQTVIITVANGVDNIVPLERRYINSFILAMDQIFEWGYTFDSAFPEEERKDLQELFDLFYNITAEGNMDKFHQLYQSEELSPMVTRYFISEISHHPDFFDETGTFKDEYTPLVTYEGEEIYFAQYLHAYCAYEKSEIDLKKYLVEVHIEGLSLEDYKKTSLDDYDLPPAIEATR